MQCLGPGDLLTSQRPRAIPAEVEELLYTLLRKLFLHFLELGILLHCLFEFKRLAHLHLINIQASKSDAIIVRVGKKH